MSKSISAVLFGEWAGRDLGRWKKLIGQRAVHKVFPPGMVVDAREDSDGVVLWVQHAEDDIRLHSIRYFDLSFRYVELKEALAREISNKQLPVEKNRLQKLRQEIGKGDELGPNDLRWLGASNHIEELDAYLQKHGANWPVAKVGAYWRKCGWPERNLEVTKEIEQIVQQGKSRAAVWSTRGAAFADLFRMKEGERCAKQASQCDPRSFYPHNLLGRIYRFQGDQELADDQFEIARKLGSAKGSQDGAKRRSRDGRPIDSDEDGDNDAKGKRRAMDEEVPF